MMMMMMVLMVLMVLMMMIMLLLMMIMLLLLMMIALIMMAMPRCFLQWLLGAGRVHSFMADAIGVAADEVVGPAFGIIVARSIGRGSPEPPGASHDLAAESSASIARCSLALAMMRRKMMLMLMMRMRMMMKKERIMVVRVAIGHESRGKHHLLLGHGRRIGAPRAANSSSASDDGSSGARGSGQWRRRLESGPFQGAVEHRSADVEASSSMVADAVIEAMEGKIAGDPAALLLIHVVKGRMLMLMLMRMMRLMMRVMMMKMTLG
jgi:hypothetical protein